MLSWPLVRRCLFRSQGVGWSGRFSLKHFWFCRKSLQKRWQRKSLGVSIRKTEWSEEEFNCSHSQWEKKKTFTHITLKHSQLSLTNHAFDFCWSYRFECLMSVILFSVRWFDLQVWVGHYTCDDWDVGNTHRVPPFSRMKLQGGYRLEGSILSL